MILRVLTRWMCGVTVLFSAATVCAENDIEARSRTTAGIAPFSIGMTFQEALQEASHSGLSFDGRYKEGRPRGGFFFVTGLGDIQDCGKLNARILSCKSYSLEFAPLTEGGKLHTILFWQEFAPTVDAQEVEKALLVRLGSPTARETTPILRQLSSAPGKGHLAGGVMRVYFFNGIEKAGNNLLDPAAFAGLPPTGFPSRVTLTVGKDGRAIGVAAEIYDGASAAQRAKDWIEQEKRNRERARKQIKF